ncbi:MAG: hypothetical protein ACOX0H_00415 [Patescibacteria group bacterium]|jgi:hypothetical protein
MTNEIQQLKKDLRALVIEFYKAYFKVIFCRKKIKLSKKLSMSKEVPGLFVIIKKYLDTIESARAFNGFMIALNKEIKENDKEGSLSGINLKKIKNSPKKSYNWMYYGLFKEMIAGTSLLAPALQKSLKTGNVAPLKKVIIDTDIEGQLKELQAMEKELIDARANIFIKPKYYKKFFLDFHKTVIAWLKALEMANEFSDTDSKLYKEPLAEAWENIEIKFKNNHDIILKIDGEESDSSYEKLGFADTRQNSSQNAAYVKSWGTLILFSTQNGRIKINTYAGDKAKRDLFKKNKQDLSKRLKAYFGLKDDPIIYNEKNAEYQIKIKLISPPDFRDSWSDRRISESSVKKSPPKEYLSNY